MANETVSKVDSADKAVRKYIEELNEFKTNTLSVLEELKKSVVKAGDDWFGAGYDNFRDYINSECAKVDKELEKVSSITSGLDSLAENYRKILAILNKTRS